MQRIFAIAWLTWKAALRFRLFLVIAVLLLAAVVGLPIIIKDDGTARGFTQILLTYTLSAITGLLGLSTLWLSCGTLARDIEECQMQVVATKPIARWQIWLGKWLGIVTLNAALLAISGGCVFGLLQWRAAHLPAAEQKVLREQVLVARGSARPPNPVADIDARTRQELQDRLAAHPELAGSADLPEVEKQIREQVKAGYQLVPPGYPRMWRIDLSSQKAFAARPAAATAHQVQFGRGRRESHVHRPVAGRRFAKNGALAKRADEPVVGHLSRISNPGQSSR